MKIDAYSHILPPRYFKRMQDIVVDPGSLKRWLNLSALHDVEFRLAMMDEFGPDFQQVLTLSSPPIEVLAGPEDSPELARLANETMAELCVQHPARFPMFVASLPMNNVEACLTEAAYAIDDLGACGVQVFTNMNGIPLDDDRFSAIFRDLAGRDLPIWLHPARSRTSADYESEDASKFEIWWALGWPYETSAAMARLVFSGIFDEHPNLKVVTHHLGGMIPYLEGRIGLGWSDQLGSRTAGEEGEELRSSAKRPLDYFRMFYADTALSGSDIGTRCGVEFFGADHVLFGTDCPFDPEGGPTYIRETIRVIDALDITARERDLIYSGNLRRIVSSAHD